MCNDVGYIYLSQIKAWIFDFVTHMTLTTRPIMLEKQR
jgi:hypothetical protein